MQNGNAFRAFVEETQHYLADKKVIDYYRESLGAAIDLRLDAIVTHFMASTSEQRAFFQAELLPEQRSLFGIYGHRAATRAVREGTQDLLLMGLVAAAVANYEIPEKRRVEVGWAVFHHCARQLGMSPADLFAQAADYATPDLVLRLVAFGNRADVNLGSFGWKELKTPSGVVYKFEWR